MWRKIATVLAALAVVGSIVFAVWTGRNQPDPPVTDKSIDLGSAGGTQALPFEVFAQATVGDWRAFRRRATGFGSAFHATAVAKVTEVTDDQVKLQIRGRVQETAEERASPVDTFPRRAITLGQLTGADRVGWKVFDIVMREETRTIAGRAFPCTKITYRHDDPLFPKKVSRVELWISKEVPAGGVVAEHEVQVLDDKRFESTLELVGFGRGDSATWGTSGL